VNKDIKDIQNEGLFQSSMYQANDMLTLLP